MLSVWTIGFLLGAVSALFWTVLDITRKHIVGELRPAYALVGLMAAQVPFVVPFMTAAEFGAVSSQGAVGDVLFVDYPALSATYLAFALGSVALNVWANWLFLRAMQISPLSLTAPYLAFTPVFSALFAWILLGQGVNPWGIAGILTVCLGAFFLNPGTSDDGWLAPLRALWTERGSLYVLVVAVVWSVTPVLDKRATDLTSPMWHTLFLAAGIAVVFVAWFVMRGKSREMWDELKIMPGFLVLAGFLLVAAMVLQLASYSYIEIAYVETLKRALGVIGAMVAGYYLFGEEDIGRRLVGAAVMVVGVAMVLFGGGG